MKDKNTHESGLIDEIKQRFGAEIEYSQPNKEEEKFLEEREKVYVQYCWDFDAFVEHYQLIKVYGLEEKGLSDLAWKIEKLLESQEIENLKETEFYSQFGDHKIIKFAFLNGQLTNEGDEFFKNT